MAYEASECSMGRTIKVLLHVHATLGLRWCLNQKNTIACLDTRYAAMDACTAVN